MTRQLVKLPLIPSPPSEAGPLACEMAGAHRRMVETYRQQCRLTAQEALARVDGPLDPVYEGRLATCEPSELTWLDLHALAERDPNLAAQRWAEIRQAALDELRTGHRAGKTLEASTFKPWDRAKFLAIREELASEWQPRNGIERTLIDAMALAYTAQLFWTERMTLFSTLEPFNGSEAVKERGSWTPPTIAVADAIEQAALMADRFNRMFMRTLRAYGTCGDTRSRPSLSRTPGKSTSASSRWPCTPGNEAVRIAGGPVSGPYTYSQSALTEFVAGESRTSPTLANRACLATLVFESPTTPSVTFEAVGATIVIGGD